MVTYSIGRGRRNDIIVDDSSVSRRHAELRVSDDADATGYVLVDLDSTNGTCLRDNGHWIEIDKASVGGDERVLLGEVVTTVSALFDRRNEAPKNLAVRHMSGSGALTAPGRSLSERLSALRGLTGDRSDHARVIGRPRRDKVDAGSFITPRIEPEPPSRGPISRHGIAARMNWGNPSMPAEQPCQAPRLSPSEPLQEPSLSPSNPAAVGRAETTGGRSAPASSAAKWAAISAVAVIVVAVATLAYVRYGNALNNAAATRLAASTETRRPGIAPTRNAVARPAPVETEWRRFFGGPGNDSLTAAARYRDGSVIFIGSGASADAEVPSLWIVRLDSTGKPLWRKRFGSGTADHGLAVTATADGGSLVSGTTDGRTVAWLVRLDAKGDQIWSRKIKAGVRTAAVMVDATSESTFTALIVARDAKTSRTRTQIVRLEADGKILWRRDLGKGDVWGTDLRRMREGGYAVAGIRRHPKTRQPTLWIARTDEDGEILWSRTLAAGGRDGRAYLRLARRDDIIAATTHQPSGDKGETTYRLVRLTRKGKKSWDHVGHGVFGVRINGLFLVKRAIVVVGAARLATPHATSPWLARIGVDGKLDWQRRFDDLAPARFNAIIGRGDHGFILAGSIRRGAPRHTDGLVMFVKPSGRPGL